MILHFCSPNLGREILLTIVVVSSCAYLVSTENKNPTNSSDTILFDNYLLSNSCCKFGDTFLCGSCTSKDNKFPCLTLEHR